MSRIPVLDYPGATDMAWSGNRYGGRTRLTWIAERLQHGVDGPETVRRIRKHAGEAPCDAVETVRVYSNGTVERIDSGDDTCD